jgi:hypothetical protein
LVLPVQVGRHRPGVNVMILNLFFRRIIWRTTWRHCDSKYCYLCKKDNNIGFQYRSIF